MCQTVVTAFERQGVQAQAVMASGDTPRQAARAFRNEGFSVIVAGGGDGTVNAVAAELIGQETVLGVLPLGTLNHFACDLGIPTNLEGAVTVLCTGKPTAVDVGVVNGLIFLNNSSLGLYPDQVRIRRQWQAKIGKWPALVLASFLMLIRFPSLLITAEFNGTRIRRRYPMLVISNNEYILAPGKLTRRERLDGGTLGLYLLQDVGRARFLTVSTRHSSSSLATTMSRSGMCLLDSFCRSRNIGGGSPLTFIRCVKMKGLRSWGSIPHAASLLRMER